MSGSLLAVAVAVAGLALTALWFGISRRRKAETEIGIQSLAHMKWRDCIAVVLEALQREGYRQTADSMATGDGGTEVLLDHGDGKVLLGYKHGTAYRLSDANVREFANALQLRGAAKGILLTLGSAESAAVELARSCDIQLIEGAALWPKVRQFIPPKMLEVVQDQASARTRNGLWAGAVASLLAAAMVYLFGNSGLGQPAPEQAVLPAAAVESASNGENGTSIDSDAVMLKQLNATALAMAEVAKLTSPELAQRRAEAARKISLISQIDRAAWSGQKSLLVRLDKTDGKDKLLIDEVCRILTQYEEMRFTRVQLEPPAGSGLAVRWRLCE